jgi:hypothetical protein
VGPREGQGQPGPSGATQGPGGDSAAPAGRHDLGEPLSVWIRRYFAEDQWAEVASILARYGAESWHREAGRVRRDAVILSRGSLDALRQTIILADRDYRDVLVGEEVDPWLIGELRRHDREERKPPSGP